MGRPKTSVPYIVKRKPIAEEITRKQASLRKITTQFKRLTSFCHAVLNNKSIASDFAGMSEILDASVKPINELLQISITFHVFITDFHATLSISP